MAINRFVLIICCAMLFALCGCSRQQSDWQKARETNTPEAYEQFLKNYPSGEFAAQAQARAKELDEERDWQKARDADTLEAYQAFLKQYPEGKWTEEARIRVENLTLAQTPAGAAPGATAAASGSAPAASRTERHCARGRCARNRCSRAATGCARGGATGAGSGILRRSARGLQIGRCRRQPALGAFAEGIPEAPWRGCPRKWRRKRPRPGRSIDCRHSACLRSARARSVRI